MKKTLVIMAAGLASRYGGAKQIEKVGPAGEILMEYTIYDARKAGFDRFVIILQPSMLEDFREVCGKRLEKKVELAYAFQSFEALPAFFRPAEGRAKPYGTVAAVLSAKDVIDGRFAVVNADDYYGPGAYEAMSAALDKLAPTGEAAMVAYRLENTVSENGTVTRGICAVENGRLTGVRETKNIGLFPDGTIRSTEHREEGEILPGSAVVSMNFWGFTPWALEQMDHYMNAFLKALPADDLKGECLLPVMVGDMLQENTLRVQALTTEEVWFGMTYKADRASTAGMLTKLTGEGKYPHGLFA